MASPADPADPPAAAVRPVRRAWVVYGIVFCALAFALLLGADRAAAWLDADEMRAVTLEGLRLVAIAVLSLGFALLLGAFFSIDIRTSVDLPFLNDASVSAVGGIALVTLLGTALHFALPGVATATDAEDEEVLAIVDRNALIRDLFDNERRPISIQTDLAVGDLAPNIVLHEKMQAVMSGRWRYPDAQADGGADPIRVPIGEQYRPMHFHPEDTDQPVATSVVSIDPDSRELTVFLYLYEDAICRAPAAEAALAMAPKP